MILKIFNYKNTAVNYTDTGRGKVVLLLHGFLENIQMWHQITPILAKRYRVITVDLLGHGKTGCYGYIHTMEDQADMLFTLLTKLRIRKVSLIGHSMGGYVALAFAELYPDNVRSLTLLNSSTQADSKDRQINRDRAIEMVKKNNKTFIRMAVHNLFDQEAHHAFTDEITFFTNEALKTPVQGVIASLEGMKIRIEREALLHFSPYPILIIASKNDNLIPLETLEKQAKSSKALLKIIPGGHVSTIEQQELVTDIIINFLKIHR